MRKNSLFGHFYFRNHLEWLWACQEGKFPLQREGLSQCNVVHSALEKTLYSNIYMFALEIRLLVTFTNCIFWTWSYRFMNRNIFKCKVNVYKDPKSITGVCWCHPMITNFYFFKFSWPTTFMQGITMFFIKANLFWISDDLITMIMWLECISLHFLKFFMASILIQSFIEIEFVIWEKSMGRVPFLSPTPGSNKGLKTSSQIELNMNFI